MGRKRKGIEPPFPPASTSVSAESKGVTKSTFFNSAGAEERQIRPKQSKTRSRSVSVLLRELKSSRINRYETGALGARVEVARMLDFKE